MTGNLTGQQVWIAIRITPTGWEFLGVASNEELAAALCHGPTDVIGPAIIDEPASDETWPGAYCPKADGVAPLAEITPTRRPTQRELRTMRDLVMGI